MKTVAILGAGKAGMHLYNQIRLNESVYRVDYFVDNFMDGEIDNIPVMKPIDYFNMKNRADVHIIAVGAQKTLGIMIDLLQKNGINEAYMMHDVAGKNRLPIFEDGKFSKRWIKHLNFNTEKELLPYVEIPITDMCNLNCKGCLFACNSVGRNEHIDKNQIISDVLRMKELFSDIPWIRILGGEPLMHPDIEEILGEVRRIFPESEVDLCTNGLFLPRLDSHFYKVINDNHISIHVSGYKPSYSILKKMDEILKQHNIVYTILKREEFFKYYTISPIHDTMKNFKECPASGCRELYRGRLMRCSAPIAFEKIKQQFGVDYEIIQDEDWYDIYDTKWDGEKLKKVLDQGAHSCKYCDMKCKEYFTWESGENKPKLSDYVVM